MAAGLPEMVSLCLCDDLAEAATRHRSAATGSAALSQVEAKPVRVSGLAEFAIKAAVTLGLLAFVLHKVDLKAMVMHIASAGIDAFALATLIILVLSALVASRWKI